MEDTDDKAEAWIQPKASSVIVHMAAARTTAVALSGSKSMSSFRIDGRRKDPV